MNKDLLKYLSLFLVLLFIIVGLEWSKPKRIDWNDKNLSPNSTKPFGTYVFNQEVDRFFSGQTVNRLYHHDTLLYTTQNADTLGKKSLLWINYDSYLDDDDLEDLLELANQGYNVFISSTSASYELEDKFHIYTYSDFHVDPFKNTVWTTNPNLNRGRFDLVKAHSTYYLDFADSLRTKYTVLGYQSSENGQLPNFVRIPYGKGMLFMHTQPLAFSNYSLLESNNHLYVENILSYLEDTEVYWITFEKEIKPSTSLLRFVGSNRSLTWAWYLFLIGMLVFIVFTSKRKQRIVPILVPLENTTVDFLKALSNLYLDNKDHNAMCMKLIKFTLEEIRSKYLIDTTVLNDDFISNFEKKSDIKKSTILDWVETVKQIQNTTQKIEEKHLIKLNQVTEKLWK